MLENGALEAALPLKKRRHPYKNGNYAPVKKECRSLAKCFYGSLPPELVDAMYVRNGSNPSQAESDDDFHWFDGDGMLSGVLFQSTKGGISPLFVNRFMLTDVYLASWSSKSRKAITPSIATLLSPITSLHRIVLAILRTVFLCFLSIFTQFPIRRISVANTAVLFHNGRALATCESGPPLWIELPTLETVGWWSLDEAHDANSLRGKGGVMGMIQEMTTAHPKSDLVTGELILYHCAFLPPYLKYSVIPSRQHGDSLLDMKILAHPISIPAPRMIHDFGASRTHTVIIDCPLSLDPLNLARGKPVVNFSPTTPTRFGVFPRHSPELIRWFEGESCCIFHTANTWSTPSTEKQSAVIQLLCCRMNSSSLVYAAGNLPLPRNQVCTEASEETCQLYYYSFSLSSTSSTPSHAFPLSIVPFEFPEVSPLKQMEEAKFVYGCTMRQGSFTVALGQASKIDCLVKFNVSTLIAHGKARGELHSSAVDKRSVVEILATQSSRKTTEDKEAIRIFSFPDGYYAQEPSFVPRQNARSEDDGFLLVYVFDESQLDSAGNVKESSKSELWVIDAWDMSTVIAKVKLPQRVPYGLHGEFFTKEQIASQRPIKEVRQRPSKVIEESLVQRVVGLLQKWLD